MERKGTERKKKRGMEGKRRKGISMRGKYT